MNTAEIDKENSKRRRLGFSNQTKAVKWLKSNKKRIQEDKLTQTEVCQELTEFLAIDFDLHIGHLPILLKEVPGIWRSKHGKRDVRKENSIGNQGRLNLLEWRVATLTKMIGYIYKELNLLPPVGFRMPSWTPEETPEYQSKLKQQIPEIPKQEKVEPVNPEAEKINPPEVEKKKTLRQYLLENFQRDKGSLIEVTVVYNQCQEYLYGSSPEKLSLTKFGQVVRNNFPNVVKRQLRVKGGPRRHYYVGLRAKSKL